VEAICDSIVYTYNVNVKVKVKVKSFLCLTKHHAMMEVNGHLHAPAALPPEKEPPVPIR
jgi:hypothetical protein